MSTSSQRASARDLVAAQEPWLPSKTPIVGRADGTGSPVERNGTPAYIKEMAGAGYPNLSAKDLISMRIQGVSPKYVQDMTSAGYKNLSVRDLISMRIQGVDSKFVKSLADAGYTNLTAKELIRLRVSGVDADFIRELSKYRTK